MKSIYDANFTYGGPIKRDRLWFFGTYRAWSANNYLGNTFDSRGNQAVDDQRIQDGTLRLTWQAARQHKIAAHYDRSAKWRGHRPNNWINASINEPVSSVVQTTGLNYIGELKWSSPISNRLLTEFAVFTMPVNYNLSFQPEADPDAIATFDQIRSVFTGVSPRQDINTARMFTYAGFVSYVTGAHNLKTGVQVRTGWSQELFETRGDIVQIVSNGVPQSVRLVNNPSGHKESGVNTGIYVQDSWTIGTRDAQPGRPLRAVRDVDPGAERRRRHVGAGARVRRAEEHRQLEHGVAAIRLRLGSVRRRPHGGQGWREPLRSAGRRHHRAAAQSEEHRLPDVPVERHQQRPACAERRDRVGTLHGIAAAQPRLRRSGPETAVSVGVQRHGAAPDRRAARR